VIKHPMIISTSESRMPIICVVENIGKALGRFSVDQAIDATPASDFAYAGRSRSGLCWRGVAPTSSRK